MSTCYIFGAGEVDLIWLKAVFAPNAQDLVIAADGGYRHLQALGIVPDLLLGDFDSLEAGISLPDIEIIRFPADKDDTDTQLAIHAGIERAFSRFVIYGGMGGRLDHTLANIQSLAKLAECGCIGFLADERQTVTAISGGMSMNLSRHDALGNVSVFSHSDRAEGVTLTGFRYPLQNAELTNRIPLGVSNHIVSSHGEIAVKSGVVVVVWESEKPPV